MMTRRKTMRVTRGVVMSGAQVFVMVNAFLDSSALSERKSERKP